MPSPAAVRRGSEIEFDDDELVVEDLASFDFSNIDIGLFSPGASVSAVYAPQAVAKGAIVIDNTSQFRYEDDIPLVVPEVNPAALEQHSKRGIYSEPELFYHTDGDGAETHLRCRRH